jgi:hypothetical protein
MAKKDEAAPENFRRDLDGLVSRYAGKLNETEMRRIIDRVLNGLRKG